MKLTAALLSINTHLAAPVPATTPEAAPQATSSSNPYLESSLEDLLQTEVSSVSRRSQRLADTAAAVFVISSEDIARSGATSLPEALRLAPGVDAARVSASRWAVSMRGSNERFSNKLLVLINGRNAFSPAFSGVFWETLQLPLSEIQQIEVVRGPGAAAWGVNAVNGVINIITKAAAATEGAQVTVGMGNVKGAFIQGSQSGRLSKGDLHYRVYATTQSGASLNYAASGADDDFLSSHLGLRLDGYTVKGSSWTVDAAAYQTESDASYTVPAAQSPFSARFDADEKLGGAHFRGRYTTQTTPGSELQVQVSYAFDDYHLPVLGRDYRQTLDFDIQQRLSNIVGHEIIFGASYRRSSSTTGDGLLQRFSRDPEAFRVAGVYAQDELRLTPTLKATLGLRLDDHEYTGIEAQPTARLLWNLSPTVTTWAAYSRAGRTPSQSERFFNYTVAFVPPGLPVVVSGSPQFDTEELNAIELGYRTQLTPKLSFDNTAFHHSYNRLRMNGQTRLSAEGLVSEIFNGGSGRLYGNELSADWQPDSAWRLRAAYTLQISARASGNFSQSIAGARHQANLRLGWTPQALFKIDALLRYVSVRQLMGSPQRVAVPSYFSADLSLKWQLRPQWELSVVGQDLLASDHAEFIDKTSNQLPAMVPRSAYAQLRRQF